MTVEPIHVIPGYIVADGNPNVASMPDWFRRGVHNRLLKPAAAVDYIAQIMTGRDSYSPVVRIRSKISMGDPDAKTIYDGIHPFSGEKLENGYTVCGSLGVSSSIGDFIYYISDLGFPSDMKEAPAYTFWGFPTYHTENKKEDPFDRCMVVAEIKYTMEYGIETVFCGGMTTFSGEGGAALSRLFSVVLLWSFLTEGIVSYKLTGMSLFERLVDKLNTEG